MDAGAVVPNFFSHLGDRCGRKGGMTPSSGDSVRLNPSSPREWCGCGWWWRCWLRCPIWCWELVENGVGELSICLIKEEILGFFSHQDGVLVNFDTHWSRVPESSAGDIHWALDAYGLLDRMGFDRVHPCFWPYGFRRELREASLFVAIMRYVGFLFSRRRHWRKISWRLRSKV
jgi:hypothetical protein